MFDIWDINTSTRHTKSMGQERTVCTLTAVTLYEGLNKYECACSHNRHQLALG